MEPFKSLRIKGPRNSPVGGLLVARGTTKRRSGAKTILQVIHVALDVSAVTDSCCSSRPTSPGILWTLNVRKVRSSWVAAILGSDHADQLHPVRGIEMIVNVLLCDGKITDGAC